MIFQNLESGTIEICSIYRRFEYHTMNTKTINIVGLCHFFLNKTKQIREQSILIAY